MNKIIKYFAKFKNFVVDVYHKNKKLFFASLALIFVFIVSFVYVVFFKTSNNKKTKTDNQNVTLDSYADGLEAKLESLLLNMKSVSDVEVFVMVNSSPIKNYLTETEVIQVGGESGSTTTTTKVVYNKSGSSTAPVEISTTPPKVSGVLIFINKIDASTKLSIINAVSIVLNIDASCISILQDS